MQIDIFSLILYKEELKKEIVNCFIQKLKLVHPEIYRLKLYVPGKGNIYVYFDITGKIFYGKNFNEKIVGENRFVQKFNKLFSDKRITDIEILNFDKILMFKTNTEYSFIFECMKRGNIIIVDNDLTIISAAKELEMKDRKIKQGEKYLYPPKIYEIPKKYISLGLSKNMLLKLVQKEKTYIYINKTTGEIIDILPFKIDNLYNNVEIVEINKSIFYVLNEYFEKEIFEKIQSFQYTSENLQFEKKMKILNHLKQNLDNLLKKYNEVEKIIEFIEKNYDKLEELMKIVNEKIKKEGFEKAKQFLQKISKNKAKLLQDNKGLYIEIERNEK